MTKWATPPDSPGTIRQMEIQDGRVVACELRSDEFTFPPPPLQESQVRMEREHTAAEQARRRYYVDVRATVHIPDKLFMVERFYFVRTARILFEVIGGALTRPRLKEWDRHRCKVFTTNYADFFTYRASSRSEASEFIDVASRCWPSGLPIAAFANNGKQVV